MPRAVGLRGGANVELQAPGARALRLAAPQIERADLGQPRVQIDGQRFARAFLLRLEHRADRRQRGHLLGIDGEQLPRPIRQPRARNVQRKFHRMANQQLEGPIGKVDLLPGFDFGRQQTNRGRFGASGFGANVIGAAPSPAAMRTPTPRRTMP